MAHVAVVGSDPKTLLNFRGELLRAIVSCGHRVTAMSASATAEQRRQLEALGVEFRSFPVQNNGLNPLADIQTLAALCKAFRQLQPDVVLAYTIKPVTWGGLAARIQGNISFFALLTGVGYPFRGQSMLRALLAVAVSWLYKASLNPAAGVIFQNVEDRDLLAAHGVAMPPEKSFVVAGSGVDLVRFMAADLPAESAPTFLCLARLLGEKGLREYAQAAGMVKRRYPEAVFRLVGPPDPSPDRISLEEVQAWQQKGLIEYLGAASDVRPCLAACHILVLPSYHEGMPRSVLEAMATGRPILTTDAPGCKETVTEGENGFLVPVRDAEALAERMIWFIEHRGEWPRMGQASRRIAERRFDVHTINAEMLRIMKLG